MATEKKGDGDFEKDLSYFDGEEDYQQAWHDELAHNIDFSSDDDEEIEKKELENRYAEEKHIGYKNKMEDRQRIIPKVDESKYQKSIEGHGPNFDYQMKLQNSYMDHKSKHDRWKNEQRNKFNIDD
jgi:hypothetical protein